MFECSQIPAHHFLVGTGTHRNQSISVNQVPIGSALPYLRMPDDQEVHALTTDLGLERLRVSTEHVSLDEPDGVDVHVEGKLPLRSEEQERRSGFL